MKKQLSDPDNSADWRTLLSGNIHRWLVIYPIVAGLIFLLACENDIEKIYVISESKTIPEVSGKNFEIIYSDSSLAKVRVLAPELKKFASVERPYTEFPRGLTAYFYDDSLQIESIIQANYVIYYNEENLWEAKNNVEARNIKEGDQLNTEHMFWDEKRKIIYSETYSKIVNKDGTFYGQRGFEATQDMKKWRLKGSKGTVYIKNE